MLYRFMMHVEPKAVLLYRFLKHIILDKPLYVGIIKLCQKLKESIFPEATTYTVY